MMSLRPNRIDLDVAISFALDIAQAMDSLHASGIIHISTCRGIRHRDLKHGNMSRFTSNQLLLENVRLYYVQSLLRCTPYGLFTSCLKKLVIVVWWQRNWSVFGSLFQRIIHGQYNQVF